MAGTSTVGELAEETGLSGSAIRYYERVGLLAKPVREGGWRRYDRSVVRLVNAIRFAKNAGFSLEEIRMLFYGFPKNTPPPERWRSLAQRRLSEVEELIAGAEAMRSLLHEGLACDCALHDCKEFWDCELEPAAPDSSRSHEHAGGAASCETHC